MSVVEIKFRKTSQEILLAPIIPSKNQLGGSSSRSSSISSMATQTGDYLTLGLPSFHGMGIDDA
jgi:hypothetical protein